MNNVEIKKYNLNNNRAFLDSLKEFINNGYNLFISIEELQSLIDIIVNWYEIKYPNRDFDNYESYFVDSISSKMNIEQLLYRLTPNQLRLMCCNYCRTPFLGFKKYNKQILNSRDLMDLEVYSAIVNNFTNKMALHITIDGITGKIKEIIDYGDLLSNNNKLNLKELLNVLTNKYGNLLDCSELESILYDYDCDVKLRNIILNLAILKLLYSKNTNLENGYYRAKKFINEINSDLGIELSIDELNKKMNINCKDSDVNLKTKRI